MEETVFLLIQLQGLYSCVHKWKQRPLCRGALETPAITTLQQRMNEAE